MVEKESDTQGSSGPKHSDEWLKEKLHGISPTNSQLGSLLDVETLLEIERRTREEPEERTLTALEARLVKEIAKGHNMTEAKALADLQEYGLL